MRFSVIIPLYNKEAEIARAIESVLNQDFRDWELLIVDDGSTDRSAEVVKPYTRDSRVYYYHQENKGVSAARNLGARRARSKYICFLDADDAWASGVLGEFGSLIACWPGAAIYTVGTRFVKVTEQTYVGTDLNTRLERGPLNDFFVAYCQHGDIINSSSVCIERTLLLSVGGFPEGVTVGEDIFTWVRLASDIGKVVVSDKRLVTVYRNEVNQRATLRLQNQLPYHLDYYFGRNGLSTVPGASRTSARRFLLRSALRHAGGAALAGDRSFAKRCASLVWKHSVLYGCMIASIAWVPSRALQVARMWRHRR